MTHLLRDTSSSARTRTIRNSLRLSSTNNGLVLRSLVLGGKEDECPKAAEVAAGVLRFPCERLTHRDARPPVIVFLLGIRPAFEIDSALETMLNLAVAHGGYLWLLRREPEEPATFQKSDPNGFRLVRLGLDGSKAVTIPLRYEVPEAIRKLAKTGDQDEHEEEQTSLDRPVINVRSLTATSKGLFFASSGYELLRRCGDRANGGDLAPVLLYVTWDDINSWLTKNGR